MMQLKLIATISLLVIGSAAASIVTPNEKDDTSLAPTQAPSTVLPIKKEATPTDTAETPSKSTNKEQDPTTTTTTTTITTTSITIPPSSSIRGAEGRQLIRNTGCFVCTTDCMHECAHSGNMFCGFCESANGACPGVACRRRELAMFEDFDENDNENVDVDGADADAPGRELWNLACCS